MPRVTVCIPHWQVKVYMQLVLRSIRRHSRAYDVEVIVVDNGSKDDSLDYLRSVPWIRLIERPEEVHTNWPGNVFTAWDAGLKAATGEYFITMHSDVFVKRDDWLEPFFREIKRAPHIAGAGAWKLEIEHPLYAFQKHVVGLVTTPLKALIGRKKSHVKAEKPYPRDYCAMYRTDFLRRNGMSFYGKGGGAGGYTIARQIWDAGGDTRMITVPELAEYIYHVAHGTAAVKKKALRQKRAQKKVENKVADLFEEAWIQDLLADSDLDREQPAPAVRPAAA